MGAGHAHGLYLPGESVAHRLAPEVKIACAVVAGFAVVATPREHFAAFGFYLLVLAVVATLARVPVGWYARRAVIELPFVLLACLLPFVGAGARTDVVGVPVSVAGTLAGWNILAKGTLGVLTALTLAATTPSSELLLGLRRLRVPAVCTTIMALMLRYVGVIVAEAKAMRTARICRGDNPRLLAQVGATARGVGMLFLRSYERGERVHRAMLARGWTGAMPELGAAHADARQWLAGLLPAVVVAVGLGVSLWTN